MGEGTTSWEDVLGGADESGTIASNAPSKPAKQSKFVCWNDLLGKPLYSPKDVHISHHLSVEPFCTPQLGPAHR